MKVFVLALLVAAVTAAPAPLEEDVGEPVEVIVNGVPEGEPLEIGDTVDIRLKQHVDGQLAAASDLLYPFSAQGLADAAAAANPEAPAEEPSVPALPEPVAPETPEVQPEPVPEIPVIVPKPEVQPEPEVPEIVPEPALPEIIDPKPEPAAPEPALPEIIDPKPEPAAPEPVPVAPEVNPEPLPVPAPQFPNGEVFNDGVVQVTVNAPQDDGVIATLQSWVSLAINYINNGIQYTQQII